MRASLLGGLMNMGQFIKVFGFERVGLLVLKWDVLWVALISLSLVWLCFGESLSYEILYWDSTKYLYENACVHSITVQNIWCVLTGYYFSNWHPVTSFSYMIEFQYGDGASSVFHFTNLFIHMANGVLFFVVSKQLLVFSDLDQTKSRLASLVATVFFVVHAHHIENIVWIAERKGLLCAFFFLLCLKFYLDCFKNKAVGERGRGSRFYMLSLGMFCLSLASKPMMVSMPFVLLLLDFFPLKRYSVNSDMKTIAACGIEKIPFFLFSLVVVVIAYTAQERSGALFDIEDYGFCLRILVAAYGIFFYMVKWLAPYEVQPFYNHPVEILEFNLWVVLGLTLFSLGLMLFSISSLLKKKYSHFTVVCFYFLSLLPVLGLIKAGPAIVADRYAYIPTMPFYILLGVGVCKALNNKATWIKLICVVFTSILFWVSTINTKSIVGNWQSNVSVWEYNNKQWIESGGKVSLYSRLAVHNLIVAYFNKEMCDKALEYLVYVEGLPGGFDYKPDTYSMMAVCYENLGMDALAVQVYEHILIDDRIPESYKRAANERLEGLKKVHSK